MQKASKKFDQRIETINKIKNPKRRKVPPPVILNQTNLLELPVITNTLTVFHKDERTQVRYDNLYSHRNNTKVQTELDSIISGALMHYKNQKINKIIFASPINNRLSLGKTYYRSSRLTSLDEPYTHHSEESSPRRKIKEGFDLTSLKLTRGNNPTRHNLSLDQPIQHNHIVTPSPSSQKNATIQTDFVMFYTAAQEIVPPLKKNMRKTFIRPINIAKKTERQTRYSPWKSQQRQEQLIL